MEYRKRQAGFTLVEVLIALGVFSIGVLSFYALQVRSVDGNAKADRLMNQLAESSDRVERFMSLAYSDSELDDDGGGVSDGIAGLDNQTAATADGSLVTDDGLYTLYWNVVVDYPMKNTKKIRVIAERNSGLGAGRKVVIDYYKTDKI